MNVVEVKNLSAGYGERQVLHGVSFEVKEKEIMGILGPNGSGKSTLVRALVGAIGSTGVIFYKGEDVRHFSRQRLAKTVAVVSQTPSRPPMDVFSYLALGRYPYHGVWEFGLSCEEKEMIFSLSRQFGVERFLGRKLSELSGGEFQMVQIVRALVQQPELLLMDEPTAHLDIHHQVRILDWLEILKERITVMIVFHDINLAALYCDRVMILSEGRVEGIGVPHEVLTYERLERVFGTPVVVYPSPLEGRPHAYLVPARFLRGDNHG
ncbi:MAG: ABC transporter ATP-binding protein [Brevinematales bacterium]|nr:ABC transporter ATP-binding protein [Brevinematales bacterium]